MRALLSDLAMLYEKILIRQLACLISKAGYELQAERYKLVAAKAPSRLSYLASIVYHEVCNVQYDHTDISLDYM